MRSTLRALLILVPSLGASALAGPPVVPGPLATGEIQLPNGRLLTPAGTQTPVASYPFALAVTPDGRHVLAASTGADDQALQLIDARTGALLSSMPLKKSWLGMALSPDGTRVYVSGGKTKGVWVFRREGDSFLEEEPIAVTTPADGAKDATPAGVAMSPDGKSLWVARLLADDVVRVDLATRTVAATVPVGHRPYRPVLSADGNLLAVANWGGASVSLVDPATAQVLAAIATDDHPCDLVFTGDGAVLFAAQANRNRVAVIDVASRSVVRQVSVALGPDGPGTPSAELLPDGSTPNALALSPDGKTLYVANADDDVVAVVDVPKDVRQARAAGFIPTGWYPDALGVSPDGKTLLVANGKGSGSRANAADGPVTTIRQSPRPKGLTRRLPGSVSRIPVPSKRELAAYTARAYANRKPAARGASPASPSKVVPAVPGQASPIKHVVYVIRENRTYDQVFGDLPRANGDPSLAIFGRDLTPNAHAIADEYGLLDNFYADAEVSADGHNWSMAAYATDFTEKLWPANYGGMAFDYLFEGSDPNAAPTAGYLWDAAVKAGRTLRNYGEFVSEEDDGRTAGYSGTFEGRTETLKGRTCPFYPGWDTDLLDNARVDLWLKEFSGYVKKGTLPDLMIVRLPNDHTVGTKKGAKTPRAMVVDNDVALGRLVEALSRSPFWKETAVFVVEDDAQNGSDHVDAHRTVALVISPYTRRAGAVDSTLYSTTSMLRTMELILGLPPMSQHDASATPMTNSFTDTPDPAPFTHIDIPISLYETNPPGAPMQTEADAWNFGKEDAAPDIALNEAIWKAMRGADSPMPAPVNAAFVRVVAGDAEKTEQPKE